MAASKKMEESIWLRSARTAFHGVSLVWYVRIWLWHATAAAALLPGAQGFGWFFRYLTFWSFSLQTLTLAVNLAHDVLHAGRDSGAVVNGRGSKNQRPPPLASSADDLACVSFAFAHVVTIMYHAVKYATNGVVEGAESLRPPWLNPSMHVLNAIIAWTELTLGGTRTFSGRARGGCLTLSASYICFILLCREMNGKFPYPFLNHLPMPSGFIGITAASLAVFVTFFQIGKSGNALLAASCGSVGRMHVRALTIESIVARGSARGAKAQ